MSFNTILSAVVVVGFTSLGWFGHSYLTKEPAVITITKPCPEPSSTTKTVAVPGPEKTTIKVVNKYRNIYVPQPKWGP